MKNLVIIAILLIVGYIAYNYINQTSSEAPSATAEITSESQSLSSTAADDASVTILSPLDGAIVSSPVTVKFGINNVQIAAAGSNIENSGHHHLLIDIDELPDMTMPLPATPSLIHFGAGQTETSLELTPGKHTLQLLLGNYLHVPHTTPVISEKITIHVKSPSPLTQ